MFLPSDVVSSNLSTWEVISKEFNYSPLQTKAFHVMGTLFQNFEAASHLLRVQNQLHADFYLEAYLLACNSLELLGGCLINAQSPNHNLETGFDFAGLNTVFTNGIDYNLHDLVALRDLAAHGHNGGHLRSSRLVVLHIELLNPFPQKLLSAYKNYYDRLLSSQEIRQKLAEANVEPYVRYKMASGHVFRNPVDYGYERLRALYFDNEDIMTVFAHAQDWVVHKEPPETPPAKDA